MNIDCVFNSLLHLSGKSVGFCLVTCKAMYQKHTEHLWKILYDLHYAKQEDKYKRALFEEYINNKIWFSKYKICFGLEKAIKILDIKVYRRGRGWFPCFDLSEVDDISVLHKNIKYIPAGIKYFKNIKKILIGQTNIVKVPREIECLSNLYNLCLTHNSLRIIPEEIGNLKLLKLSLAGNFLSESPEKIYQMTSLADLNLSGNCFKQISNGIGNLINLKLLDISRNQLITLPSELFNLRLSSLDLRNNIPLKLSLAEIKFYKSKKYIKI